MEYNLVYKTFRNQFSSYFQTFELRNGKNYAIFCCAVRCIIIHDQGQADFKTKHKPKYNVILF